MAIVEVRNKIFPLRGVEFPVKWASYDFIEDVKGINDDEVRQTLVETGVMYLPSAEPKIRVSHMLDPDLQGLSALHEELCMVQEIEKCPEVEEIIVSSLTGVLKDRFVDVRLRMFGALCVMNPGNETFAHTRGYLERENV